MSFVTTRTRAKKGSAEERKASLTIRIDKPTERALSALAVREGRTLSDVARRLLRVGIDTYEPEDKRPPVPNTRKLAAIAGPGKNDTILEVAERLKELAGDVKLPSETEAYLRMILDKVGQRSSLVPHEGPDDLGTMVAAYGMPPFLRPDVSYGETLIGASAVDIDRMRLQAHPVEPSYTAKELEEVYNQHALETQGDWAAPRKPPPMTEAQIMDRVRALRKQREPLPPFDPETDAMRVRRRPR